jgi:hypothetical protein
MKPEMCVFLMGLVRREKQRLLGKPIDPPCSLFTDEQQLLTLDTVGQELQDEFNAYYDDHA